MPDRADDLVEASLRRAIRGPRLSSYKPRRFAAGDERGGEFAPKGMGTVAYGMISDALAQKPDAGDVVWSSGPMAIVAPRDTPGNRPEWRPSMTRGEAEQWRQGNVLVGLDAGANEFYHGTSDQARVAIEAEGFRLSEVEFGRLWGDGVYLTPEFNEAHHYARENPMNDYSGKETFHGGVVTVFPRVTNPAVLDMTSDKWADAWARADSRDDTGFAGWRATVIDFFDLWEDFESAAADDGIERSGSFMQWVTKVLRERGHDALVVNGGSGMNGRTDSLAVVFDPKNVVAIQNAKPPKWFRDRHGITEGALRESIRRLGLRGAVRKRYAKGTIFGGRFLPKGKSPFGAPRVWIDSSDDDLDMARSMMRVLRGLDDEDALPDPLDVFDLAEGSMTDWTRREFGFEAHRRRIPNGGIAKDITMGDGRHVRLIVDADVGISDDEERLEELRRRVSEQLGLWEGRATFSDFPPYVVVAATNSPLDEEFADQFGGDEFKADATASDIDKSIAFWNMADVGTPSEQQSFVDVMLGRNEWSALNPEILDHEIGHIVGVSSGPPDLDSWFEAVMADEFHASANGYEYLRESYGPLQTELAARSIGGISDYAARWQSETGGFQEDWAETVRIYMKELRGGEPVIIWVKPTVDEDDDVIDEEHSMVWLKDWSPGRYALVDALMNNQMVEAALAEALGRITSGKFSARRAMFLKGVDGKFVGSRGRGGPSAVRQSRAASAERARKIASDRANLYGRRDKPLKKSVTLGVTPYRGAGRASGDDYYETTRYKGFVNDIGKFANEEGVRVQGIQRVRGVWRGGGEPSAAVTLFGDDDSVQRVMDRLGTKYNQDGVLSFRPSGGGDSFRFRSAEKIDPAALEEAMLDDRFSSIAGATILPDGRVEFVNIGGDPDTNDQIEQLAEALGIEIRYDLGNAGLRLIEEDYPRRTNPPSGSQSSVQEGGFRPGRGIDHLPREGSGGPSPSGSREDQALAEAVRGLGLRGYTPRRYARGTSLGGRFLPKGVSPYSGPAIKIDDMVGYTVSRDRYRPERIGVGPMNSTQFVVKRPNQPSRLGRTNDINLPGIDTLVDPKTTVREWTRIGAFDESGEYINGAFVKDLTVRRGRKTRIVIDADIDIARDPVARDEFFSHVQQELSLWADLAPRKRFPRRIFVSSGPYRLPNADPQLTVRGTADIRDKTIDIWNVPQYFGRENRGMIDGKARYAEFRMKTVDHEIAHTIAPGGGPPDRKVWEEAMVRDGQHHRRMGVRGANDSMGWQEPDWEAERVDGAQPPAYAEDGSPRINATDDYGITRYASVFTQQNLGRRSARVSPLSEDWAESVSLFVDEKRSGVGPFIVQREEWGAPDGYRLVRVPFSEWAPNRAKLIEEYLNEGKMTRGDAISYPPRFNDWPVAKEGE